MGRSEAAAVPRCGAVLAEVTAYRFDRLINGSGAIRSPKADQGIDRACRQAFGAAIRGADSYGQRFDRVKLRSTHSIHS